MTVSHVINEHPHVKDATRERVLQSMTELDYRVNVAARNLRTGRTGTIGLAVPEVNRPYYGQLGAAIIEEAARHFLHVVIEQTGASRENELDALALSRNRMYDGLILSTVGLGPADTDLLRVDYPVVILGERIFDGPVDHVAMPNVAGAKAAVAHLVEAGCTAIALVEGVDFQETSVSGLRMAGFESALAEAGIEVDPQLIISVDVFSLASGVRAAQQLVASGRVFDGVFCITDTIALGMLRGLHELGVRVPQDVKVIGFDNIEEGGYSVPSLSTVDPDHAFMAKRAVELLVRRIASGSSGVDPQEVTSAFRVVARESSSG
ncbi:LacI family transcriptional regulator [Subtercola endophyticus]|nr:LacI family transcriptional regulator [Subtercola endophyticus]